MDRGRLARSRDRIIAGVCGGIAEYLGWSPTTLRLAYAFVSIISAGFGIIVYLVLMVLMPKPDDPGRRFNVHHPDQG